MQKPSRVVASFPDYAGAQYAVDALADRKVPVDGLAIVGANLQSFEQVTGRRAGGSAPGMVAREEDTTRMIGTRSREFLSFADVTDHASRHRGGRDGTSRTRTRQLAAAVMARVR